MVKHDCIQLLGRARAALETPGDLDADALSHLVEDLALAEDAMKNQVVPWPVDIHIAEVGHRNGNSVYIGLTRKAMMMQVIEFCREYWLTTGDPRDHRKLTDGEVVSVYFEQDAETLSTYCLSCDLTPEIQAVPADKVAEKATHIATEMAVYGPRSAECILRLPIMTKTDAETIGFASFNDVPTQPITIPDGGFTLSAKTSEGRRATFYFGPYRDGGPPRFIDIQYHDAGMTVPAANGSPMPVFDMLTIARGGRQPYDSRKAKLDDKPAIAVILLDHPQDQETVDTLAA